MWKRNHSLPEQIERGLVMNENLFRPQFDTLKLSDKLWLMQTLATRYNLTFKELYAFSRWGQSCTTGLFEKGGREFVFVPGDTVILGWEGFVQGMDKANQEELADIFAEIEYEGSEEEFLRQGMTPVRQVTIGPMFVGRKLEEIGWESVPMNDPRITAHPDWLENLQKWAGQNSQSFEIHETVRFERNGDSWRAWLCHPMTYPEFQRSLLWEVAASLPTPDEWAYLCGGGCRTLFPWGDGLDHKMKLHHFESEEDQGKGWDELPYFACRKRIFHEALVNHSRRYFISSVTLLTVHTEGVITDFVRTSLKNPRYKVKKAIEDIKRELEGNNDVSIYEYEVFHDVIDRIEKAFTEGFEHSNPDAASNESRDKIAHGHVYEAENEVNSLKKFLYLNELYSLFLYLDKKTQD